MHKRILELKSIRERIDGLKKREDELLEPSLTDLKVLPMIYEWISDLSENERFSLIHYFVIVSAILYSPRIFIGKKLEYGGVRKGMAAMSGLSEGRISNILQEVREWYFIYKDFQGDVDYLSTEILRRINQHGINGIK